jgi:hypothetical protein
MNVKLVSSSNTSIKETNIMTFTQAFTPALNKDGFAKITFLELKTLSGRAGDISEKKGVIYEKDWEINNLVFECQGMQRGSTQNIAIKINTKYSNDNALGVLLKNMGYIEPQFETELDEDGFEIVKVDEDEDGFATVESLDLGIDDFIKESIGKVFIGKVFRESEGSNKGRLTIDIATIKPFVSKKK